MRGIERYISQLSDPPGGGHETKNTNPLYGALLASPESRFELFGGGKTWPRTVIWVLTGNSETNQFNAGNECSGDERGGGGVSVPHPPKFPCTNGILKHGERERDIQHQWILTT